MRRLSKTIILLTLLLTSCTSQTKEQVSEQGVVIYEKAQLLASTALVSTPVRELKRGDTVDILERQTVNQREFVKIRYTPSGEKAVEGWLESRHVLSKPLLDESNKLAKEWESIATQALGRTKDKLKLRVSPSRDSSVLTLLPSGTQVEIVGRVRNERKVEDGQKRFDRWYKVRLGEEYLTKAGWLYADSVELTPPDAIAALPGGSRRFAAWMEFGGVADEQTGKTESHYVILDKFTFSRDDEVDFDRIYIVVWKPDVHAYGSIYVESGLRGLYPMNYSKEGGIGTLVLQLIDKKGEQTAARYLILTDPKTGQPYVRKEVKKK